MVTAIVLLKTSRDAVNEVAERLVDMKGASEVHSAAGRYEFVSVIRVPDNQALADNLSARIRSIDGIESPETLIGFRVYSKHDLVYLFAVSLQLRLHCIWLSAFS